MKFVTEVRWRAVFGELLIVVVGILIALQVDRWDSRRQDLETARAYAVRLAADLEANERTFLGLADRAERKAAAADSVIECMSASECPRGDQGLRGLINRVRGGAPLGLRSATFVTMMNTGALALISDPLLREDLVRYYEDFPMPQVPDVVMTTDRFVMPLFELMSPHIDERVMNGPAQFRAENPLFITSWARLSADSAVASQLRLASAVASGSAPYFREMADSTRALRARILEDPAIGSSGR